VKKILVFTLSFITVSLSLLAQDATTTTPTVAKSSHARPNIPGTFVLELGLNRIINPTDKFDIGFWGSRAMNIYYQYDMRILKSKFSFHPGIGFGLERYKFKNSYAVAYDNSNVLSMQSAKDLDFSNLKKSQLITNYLDIPLELRFSTNPEDPARSFKVSIGVRGGYLFNAHTKLKHKEDGVMIKEKENRDFSLNKFRYGVFAKIGGGNFSFFGYYNLSTLFKTGQSPIFLNADTKDMNNFTIGISLSSF